MSLKKRKRIITGSRVLFSIAKGELAVGLMFLRQRTKKDSRQSQPKFDNNELRKTYRHRMQTVHNWHAAGGFHCPPPLCKGAQQHSSQSPPLSLKADCCIFNFSLGCLGSSVLCLSFSRSSYCCLILSFWLSSSSTIFLLWRTHV